MQNVCQFTRKYLLEIQTFSLTLLTFSQVQNLYNVVKLICVDLFNWMCIVYECNQLSLKQFNESSRMLLGINSKNGEKGFKSSRWLFSKCSTAWWITVYCLMPLVCELPSSVYLSGITFTHHDLNVSSLPT